MKQCLFTMLALFTFSFLQGQSTVEGAVKDSKGEPVIGATVLLTGTSQGTVTDFEGNYKLEGLTGTTASLTVSYVGFLSQVLVVDLTGRSVNANFTLQEDTKVLDEVVVVAYGTRRKEDLTGSVTSVTTKDFQKGNIVSSDQLLVGKVAGLQVTSGGGAAGGGSKLRIRSGASLNANNDPLIVIDGIPVDGNQVAGSANFLNTINPNDIESISVLKDASATALYGSRASNGVIIITTKKGQKGKLQFNFNTQVSLGTIAKKVDVYTGDEIRKIVTDINSPIYVPLLGTANTDWQDQIYQNAFGNDNNLSVGGTVGNIPFRASVGYLNQDGILKTNNFKRLSGSLNLTPSFLDDHLKVNIAVRGMQTKNVFAEIGRAHV